MPIPTTTSRHPQDMDDYEIVEYYYYEQARDSILAERLANGELSHCVDLAPLFHAVQTLTATTSRGNAFLLSIVQVKQRYQELVAKMEATISHSDIMAKGLQLLEADREAFALMGEDG